MTSSVVSRRRGRSDSRRLSSVESTHPQDTHSHGGDRHRRSLGPRTDCGGDPEVQDRDGGGDPHAAGHPGRQLAGVVRDRARLLEARVGLADLPDRMGPIRALTFLTATTHPAVLEPQRFQVTSGISQGPQHRGQMAAVTEPPRAAEGDVDAPVVKRPDLVNRCGTTRRSHLLEEADSVSSLFCWTRNMAALWAPEMCCRAALRAAAASPASIAAMIFA